MKKSVVLFAIVFLISISTIRITIQYLVEPPAKGAESQID